MTEVVTRHVMHTLDRDGDQRIEWDADEEHEVDAARRAFHDLRAKGYLAYSAAEGGGRGEQIRAFDPNAERIVLVKPHQGG